MNIPPRPDLPPPPPPSGAQMKGAALPRASWTWYAALGIYFAGLIVAGLMQPSDPPSGSAFFVYALIGEVIPGTALLIWLVARHQTWRLTMGFPRATWLRDVGFGAVGGVLTYLIGSFGIAILLAIVYRLVTGQSLQTPDQIPVEISGVRVVLAILMAVIAAPVVEEFFFRGCLFRGFRARYSFWPSAIGSALFFGLAHYSLEEGLDAFGRFFLVILMFFVGLSFAWIYERRGSLWSSIAAHMAFNIIGLSLIATATALR
jgi:ABC-2 type transport system permease protein